MRRLREGQDAFGHEIRAAFAGEHPMEIIERDDGLLEVYSAAYMLAPYAKWPSVERKALRYVRGRVLDVGAGRPGQRAPAGARSRRRGDR